jgi:hypothetical protein
MSLLSPWGLLALLAVPAVVVLHWFRRRLPERRVAAAFLFGGDRLAADAGRQRTTLLRTPSLWLECAAAALLALWLAEPTFGGANQRHVVFVLDDSASMAAGSTRADAIADVEARLAALGGSDRVTVLRTGPRPDVLVGPRALPAEVGSALARWRPVRPSHAIEPALELARELAAGGGEVVLVTDRVPSLALPEATVVALGRSEPNAALLSAQRFLRRDGTEELRVAAAGFGELAATRLVVRSATAELAARDLTFAAGHARVTLELPADTGPIGLQLAPDALALDNEATLLPEPVRTVVFCDLLPPERRTELQFDRVLGALDACRADVDPLAAQVLFVAEPGQPVAGQIEVVLPRGDGPRSAYQGAFVVERSHPWTAGVTLQGVAWLAEDRALPGQPLVTAGRQVLVSEEFLELGRRAWLNVDGSRGNLVRAPDWPVLLANLVDAARLAVPGPERSNVLVGGEARFRRSLRADGEDVAVTLVGPDGTSRPGTGGATLGWVIDQPGLHRLVGRSGGDLGRIAARFLDAAESDLAGRQTRTLAATAHGDGAAIARDTGAERRWLLLLLGAVLLLDWWWLTHRRWRLSP